MKANRFFGLSLAVASVGLLMVSDVARAQLEGGAEHPAINYSKSTPADPIARLQRQVDSGAVKLQFDEKWGYLPSVLKALNVPVSSQGLVFSKTSLQVDHIGPWAPRAVYFNDDVYVGFVQGGPILEVASVDPKLGSVFYSLSQEPNSPARFDREGSTCLMCHDSRSNTGGVPGLIVRSVIPDRHGYAIGSVHEGPTTDTTPIESRWGGWYVTGKTNGQPHMGNVMSPSLTHEVGNLRSYVASGAVKPASGAFNLSDRFDPTAYLTDDSDAVAIMVLTHQAHIHNLITAAGYEARMALYDDASGDGLSRRAASAADALVRAMFFVGEAPLTAPIQGTSSFAAEFAARGISDARGRSLRELDLQRHLFTNRLSYLVYSDSFNALPDAVKSYVYRRFREVLSGVDTTITHLSAGERQTILEILEATKPDFAAARL